VLLVNERTSLSYLLFIDLTLTLFLTRMYRAILLRCCLFLDRVHRLLLILDGAIAANSIYWHLVLSGVENL
jgi:hypothetical protein